MERDLTRVINELRTVLATLEAKVVETSRHAADIETYRHALRTSGDVFLWVVDSDLRFVLSTDTIAKVFGEPPSRMAGRYLFDLRSLRRWDDNVLRLHALIETRHVFRDVLLPITDRNGQTREVLFSGEPWFDAEGRFGGYRGVAVDLTCPDDRPKWTDPSPEQTGGSRCDKRGAGSHPATPDGTVLRLVHSIDDHTNA
jgi:PAS domain S-box-containing protein